MRPDKAAEPETECGLNHLVSSRPYSSTAGLTVELSVWRALKRPLGISPHSTTLVCDSSHLNKICLVRQRERSVGIEQNGQSKNEVSGRTHQGQLVDGPETLGMLSFIRSA